MNESEFIDKIKKLFDTGLKDSYSEIISLVDSEIDNPQFNISKSDLNGFKRNANIGILKLELDALDDNDYKNEINLRGRLISLYKEAEKECKDESSKMKFRYECLQQLELQKNAIKKYRNDSNSKISIPKNVGLKIQEISKTIEVFMKKHDVIKKLGNIFKGTTSSVSSVAAISAAAALAIKYFTGLSIPLFSLSSLMPVIAYSGLAGIISNISSKTPFEQYIYQQSDEYKELVKEFMDSHKGQLEEIAKVIKTKNPDSMDENLIATNETLIKLYDELIADCDIQGVKDTFKLQALDCFYENRDCCESIIDDYLNENNNDKDKYKEYNKKLKKINLEIFTRGNSIKDAIKNSGKNVAKSMGVMLLTRSILNQVAPQVLMMSSGSIELAFAYALINGVIDIPTYKNKLKFKESNYRGKININNKKRIEEILEMKKNQSVYA